ncbi:MAG TPA: VWA domain-containing protein [Thermoanaerobaculia bacterium]|nr:VWA domain-containing protein [Thermoanaerobaculia bacterium]
MDETSDQTSRPAGAVRATRSWRRFAGLLGVLAFALLAAGAGPFAGPAAGRPAPEADGELALPLSPEHARWLELVGPLIGEEERAYFLALRHGYRREAFIERFWKVRDPYPATAYNELRRGWETRAEEAQQLFGSLEDKRAVFFLFNGPPGRFQLADGRVVGRCFVRTDEMEVWFYGGSERTPARFAVVFAQTGRDRPYDFWHRMMIRHLVKRSRLPTTDVSELCGDELLPLALRLAAQLAPGGSFELFVDPLITPDPPPAEWVATFDAFSTELPPDAETFEVMAQWQFPARNQNRTVVRGILSVAPEAIAAREFEGRALRQLQLTGEVLRDGSLFETFRYRFEVPPGEDGEPIPLVISRSLRPGMVTFQVKIEDVFGGRFGRLVEEVEIPSPAELEARQPSLEELVPFLAEANEAARRGEWLLRLIPPREERVRVGMVRFAAQTAGEIDRVTFFLDGKPILTKNSPPYDVELNLGSLPQLHRIRAVATLGGEEVASDEMSINRGGQRFRVRLVEPRPDRTYRESLEAAAEVETSDAQTVDRVEIFLDETRVATLYQPPWVQPIVLRGDGLSYVRAVAHLPDGSSTEDVVFVNAPDYLEHVEVQYVEVFASVLDEAGRPRPGLEREAFRVYEDGELQTLRRFEFVDDLPIHAGLLIDTSSSMEGSIASVAAAAEAFVDQTLRPKDRLCVIPFSTRPEVAVRFTNQPDQIKKALAGLDAVGGTALYDSLVFTLHYFDGITGQKALLLLSDGKDEASAFSIEQALETARRSGVTIYAIGLKEAAKERAARKALREIAEETGGRAYFIESPDELAAIYQEVQRELRARYLLAYQSSSDQPATSFRAVRVEVDAPGKSEVRAMSGYYP